MRKDVHPTYLIDPESPEVAARILGWLKRALPHEHEEDIALYGRELVNAMLGKPYPERGYSSDDICGGCP